MQAAFGEVSRSVWNTALCVVPRAGGARTGVTGAPLGPSRSGTLATHWLTADPLSPRMRRRIPQTAPTGVPWAWLAAGWLAGDHNPSAWTHTCLLMSPQPVPMSSLSVGTAPRMGGPAHLPALYYGPSAQASPSASASRNSCLLLPQARPTPW